MSNNSIYHLVRSPDDRYEKDGIMALTRKRLLELFPNTPENLLQDDALLVPHPYLHDKYSKTLLPAEKLYEALREEAESELCDALVRLGATEMKLTYTTNEKLREGMTRSGEAQYSTVKLSGSVGHNKSSQTDSDRLWKITLHGKKPVIDELDETTFFSLLVYNKDNRTLRLLFNAIKEGNMPKEFQLDFRHSTCRNNKLEVHIEASLMKLNKAKVDFKGEFEMNRVERATFTVKF